MIILSDIVFVAIYISTAVFIWIYTPVENPIHCLDENERKKYAKNTRKIILFYGIMMLVGICIKQKMLLNAIVWAQVLTGIAMAAGLWKYKI